MTKKKIRPHAIEFTQPSLTRQSFKDECDVNQIVKRYTETGMVNHIPRIKPQYGDAPEGDFLEAAIVNADIASQIESGDLDMDDLMESESEAEPSPEPDPNEPENGSQEASADASSTSQDSA